MDTVQEIMSSIDNIKNKLTSEEYKELCDKMMSLKKVEDKKTFPVQIWFMTVSCSTEREEGFNYLRNCYNIKPVSRIVLMNYNEFKQHKKDIETLATHVSDYHFNKPHMLDVFTHNRLDYYHEYHSECTEEACECCQTKYDSGAIYPVNRGYCVKIYHLQKMEELGF